ncbi:hypothetical protein [Sporisorium scitamineum]|uniref:Uncharacterized protein n=1 Tax=Sporisorium scitamineum TaxID=49012 RepID=A0A0F7RTT0_9BASI|nr:hypothetical protein [Sporisorium scitamineum]
MTLPPPLTQSQSMAEDHLAAPTATQTRDEGQVEKTMFFQSDFSSHRDDSALVMQLLEATLAEVLTDEQLTLAMDSQEANSKLGPKPKLQHAIQLRKHLYWALGTCAVLATVLGLYLSMGLPMCQ